MPCFFARAFLLTAENLLFGGLFMTNQSSRNKSNTTKIAITAMLTAVAVVLQYIEFPIPIMPPFIKLDFSDIPELIGAFVISPLYGVIICLLKNLIHLPFGNSAGIGELANFLMGAVFAFTAGIIYKHNKTKKTALLACIIGALAMAAFSVAINYFIVYPAYAVVLFKGSSEPIVKAYMAILPASDNIIKSLLIFNFPFTFVKGIICAIVTILIYKPLSNIFVKMNDNLNKKQKADK